MTAEPVPQPELDPARRPVGLLGRWPLILARRRPGLARMSGVLPRMGWLGFLVFVVLPTLATAVYQGAIASPEYVSEARFVIRNGVQDTSSPIREASTAAASIARGLGVAPASGTQDAYIVTNFIAGRSIIDILGGTDAMHRLFSGPDIDWWSRLSPTAGFEATWKYWQGKVLASLDVPSGIVILEVRAFSPGDAERLAREILSASESLVNKMSERMRVDALGRARAEFAKAREQVERAQRVLLEFRNNNRLLDPMLTAGATSEVLAGLFRDKLALENEMATTGGLVSGGSPVRRLQQSRLDSLNEQIEKLMTSLAGRSSDRVLATQLAEYEELQLDLKFAEKLFDIGAAAVERAHREVERQQLYLFTIVRPALPEKPTYPRPVIDTLLIFVWSTIAWSIVSLTLAGVRDHT